MPPQLGKGSKTRAALRSCCPPLRRVARRQQLAHENRVQVASWQSALESGAAQEGEASASRGARDHGDPCQVSLELASLLLRQPRSQMSWASRTLAPLFSTGQASLHSHGSLLALPSTPQQPKASHSFLSKAGELVRLDS